MKLLLRPGLALSEPQGWSAVTELPHFAQHADEVVCLGGGSLLLWLLFRAGKAPWAARRVSVYGPLTYPTPESCALWAARLATDGAALETHASQDPFEWRRQATLMLSRSSGDRGRRLRPEQLWIVPLLEPIAAGRFADVHREMDAAVERWAATGRVSFSLGAPAKDAVPGQVSLSMTMRKRGLEPDGGGQDGAWPARPGEGSTLLNQPQSQGWYCLTP